MAAKIISIVNNKGGVAKTTSTAFFGEILSLFGKKVLVVDTDESGNLSLLFNKFTNDNKEVMLGVEEPKSKNISEIYKYHFRSKDEVTECIYNIRPNLDIIPASGRLRNIPDTLLLQARASNINNNIILKKALQTVSDQYDYIFIDSAPRNDILIINNLMASDYILIPVRSDGFSLKGFKEVANSLGELQAEYDISAQFLGLFQVAAETNTNIYKELDAEYSTILGPKNLPSIRKDVKVNELLTVINDSIIDYTSASNVLYDYCMLLLATGILDKTTERLIKAAYSIEE